MYIFRANGANTTTQNKIYSCTVYDNQVKVRDFIPCYRKSDSVAWMYDLVNDVFYPSASSVPFVAWPEV